MHNIKARDLKAIILRKFGKIEEERKWLLLNLEVDPFDYISYYELALISKEKEEKIVEMNQLMRGFHESYLQCARDYAEFGCYAEAIALLDQCRESYPLLAYYKGYYLSLIGKKLEAHAAYEMAETVSPLYCFPNKLEDIAVLSHAIQNNSEGAKAYYYLGNLYYDKLQFERATLLWEKSIAIDDGYPTAHRNLALAYYNKKNDAKRAKTELEKAFALDETDARVFLELDQLYKKLGKSFEERLGNYEKHMCILKDRDDVMLEFVSLCNLAGMHEKAYETIMSHTFRPWEGAEGRVSTQYKIALVEIAKEKISKSEYAEAKKLLECARYSPKNLGEGRLEGTKDNNVYYYLGIVNEQLDNQAEAIDCFAMAELGIDEPAGVLYYYDQPADMILYKGLANLKIGNKKAAYSCFNKLMDYGERHLKEEMKNDFFAVSLPDFLIFEDDMNLKNQAHCYYLMGLSYLGMDEKKKAKKLFEKAIAIDYNHQNARIYLKMTK